MKGVNSFDENGYWSRYSNDNWSVCKIYDNVLGYEYTLSGESFDALEVVDKLASLESQLADAQARLAGYEVGYDPATNPPDDSAYVFVKTNDGGQYYAVYDCPSDDSIARFIVLPCEEFTPIFSINNIARWFPLPGAAFGELAKGAE